MGPDRAAGMEDRPDRLPKITPKHHSVKNPSEGVELPLQTLGVG